MSENQRFERGARTWLEEGPTRAPERAISEALATIESTPQERSLRVPWRMPVMSLPIRLAAVALLVALAAGGTFFVAGALPDTTPAETPVPAVESPSPDGEAMVLYRVARHEICNAAMTEREPLVGRYVKATDPNATEAERAEGLVALKENVVIADRTVAQLAVIDVPPEFVADHASNVAQFRDMTTLIREVIALLEAGNLADAGAVDRATDPIGGQISEWESMNRLSHCP